MSTSRLPLKKRMKKLIASILLLIYFTVSTGFIVSVHYCMNKVQSVEWGTSDEHHCGKCGMTITKDNGCCKDDVKLIKLKIEQPAAKLISHDFSIAVPAVATPSFFSFTYKAMVSVAIPTAHGPPLGKEDTYLKNCVFRI